MGLGGTVPIIAVATERGWPNNSHGAFRSAVKLLATRYDDPRLMTFFDSAEKLHGNFYHSNLTGIQIGKRREQAERLISLLLGLFGER